MGQRRNFYLKYFPNLKSPYYFHHTNLVVWRTIMSAVVVIVTIMAIYAAINIEFLFKSPGIWITMLICLVLISNFKVLLNALINPKKILQFIWYPRIQFAADRNGLYFNSAWQKGRLPKVGEIVFTEWARIESIGFERRRGQRRILFIKLKLTQEEVIILGGLTITPFSREEITFINETANEKKVLDTLSTLRGMG